MPSCYFFRNKHSFLSTKQREASCIQPTLFCQITAILKEAPAAIAQVQGALVVDAKGIYDAVTRMESAALAMRDKRSAVEGLALKKALDETMTMMRRCPPDQNLADALTKYVGGEEMLKHMEGVHAKLKRGRHQLTCQNT